MKNYFIADTHSDTLMHMIDRGWELDDDRLQVSLNKMLNGGHDLQIFACFINPIIGRERYVIRTLQMIDLLKGQAKKHRRKIAVCTSVSEIKYARKSEKKIALLGIEGGHAIQNDLSILRCYRDLGVTYMTLTWSNTNDWCDSSNDEERWGGLTEFGHDVVREMNRIGMMVDISHVSDKAFWHALQTSSKPLIASHSSVRTLCNHQRNMRDEMIQALAEKGGVIFINFFPSFIHQGFSEAYEKLTKRLQRKFNKILERHPLKPELAEYEGNALLQAEGASLPAVKMKDVIQHIEYVAKIAGVESVGFGSDFDGTPFMPENMNDCTSLPRLCEELQKRKFTPAEIDKIAGGNFLRVFSETVG